MKTPNRPDFPECPLLFFGSGFFVSSSWSTGKKEMNECSFEKMYNNTPTETKAKGESRRAIHQQRLKVLSEPCWIVTHQTALKPNLWGIPGDKVKALDPLLHTLRCSSPPIKQRRCS
ncbi:hypothetical protein V6N12_028974 [Hibiscus sabdariffa]|uniref:Uncharacterized protein n=1 Tax=Hibiscus sabdariffa TaxID=183260 RepID=A0ABR2F7C8_9ROSI